MWSMMIGFNKQEYFLRVEYIYISVMFVVNKPFVVNDVISNNLFYKHEYLLRVRFSGK